jgi:membrane-bound lytic murein transglycosylase B
VGVHSVRARTTKPARVAPQRRWRAAAAVTAMLAPMVLAGDATFAWVNTAHSTPTSQPAPKNPLGATGQLPQQDTVEPTLPDIGDAASTDGAGELGGLPNGPLGIPGAALDAYRRAEQLEAARNPKCHMDWPLLAGIGRIESNHARGGAVDAQGNTLSPILGPRLDGSGGFALIYDTDHGQWDFDPTYDHAVGMMQFIPSTWAQYAAVSNAKNFGTANPNNIYDAAFAAANYLCASGGDMRDPAARSAAVFGYNHSDAYVANVLSWAHSYASGVETLPNNTDVPVIQPIPKAPFVGPSTPPPPPPNTTPSTPSSTTTTTTTPTSTTTTSPTGTTTSTSQTTTSTSTSTTTSTTTTTTTTTTPTCPTTPTSTPTPTSSATPTSAPVPPGCPTPATSPSPTPSGSPVAS